MLPNAPFAVLILLALIPGWIFFRLAETKAEPPDRSQLAELLELTAVGLFTIALSVLAVAGLSTKKHYSWLFDVEVWARSRHQYLGNHLGPAIASTVLVIALSCVLAVILAALVYGRRKGGFHAGRTVWVAALGTAPSGMQNWIGVHRHDGSLIEGLMFSCTAGTSGQPREISLKAPIRVTPFNGQRADLTIDRVVIPDAEIAAITVVHVPKEPRRKGTLHWSMRPLILRRRS